MKDEYEVFVGASNKKYYVVSNRKLAEKIKEELKHKLKVKNLYLILVWIKRGIAEKDGVFDYLYTERKPGATEMVAFITPGRKRKEEE